MNWIITDDELDDQSIDDYFNPEIVGIYYSGFLPYKCNENTINGLYRIKHWLERRMFYLEGKTPFDIKTYSYKNGQIEIHSDTHEDRCYNFKWRDVKILWQGTFPNFASINKKVSEEDVKEMIKEAIFSITIDTINKPINHKDEKADYKVKIKRK